MAVDVVILNLTRFGDLLQSQALINDLHASGHRTGLVCLDNFAPALPLLRHVDMSWQLPGGKIRAMLDKNWACAASGLLEFAGQISGEGKPKFVLNLIPSLPARLLARLLANAGARMLGFGLDEHGYGVNRGLWASFLAVAAGRRINSPFNVADLFRMLAFPLTKGISGGFQLAGPDAESRQWAKKFLDDKKPALPHKGYVAFQLGASEDRRRWPEESFRKLGSRIWEEAGYVPLLLGSAGEKPLAESYAQNAAHPFIDAIGRTSPMRLAALLSESALLVTNDTGTMHLASGMGTPILSFFLATAQPWDTGPMSPGACCLEPDMDCHPCAFGTVCEKSEACRAEIGAGTAAELALAWLLKKDWKAGISPRTSAGARIWLMERDERGMALPVLAGGSNNARGAWMACMRIFWRQLLDDIDITSPRETRGQGESYLEQRDFHLLGAVAAQAVPALEGTARLMATIGELGAVATKSAQARQLFLLNCERAQTLLNNSPPLGALSGFWRELRECMGSSLDGFLPVAAAIGHHSQRLAAAQAKTGALGPAK